MKAGLITDVEKIIYTRMDSDVPFPPSEVKDGKAIWSLEYITDYPLDITYKLSKESFVGAISFTTDEDYLKKAEVRIKDKLVGIYQAQTNSLAGGDIVISVTERTDEFTLRIYPGSNGSVYPGFKDLVISNVEILGIINENEPVLYPYPKNVDFEDGYVKIKEITTLCNDADELFVKSFLEDELKEMSTDGVKVVIEKNTSDEFANERYVVSANDNEIRITAATRLTLLYGADTILKLLGTDNTLRKFTLDDKPSSKIRGFHMGLPKKKNFDFAQRFFRYVLLPLRYNMVIVEFAGGMRFDKHPEISEAWLQGCKAGRDKLQPLFPHDNMGAEGTLLEKEDAKKFVGYIKDLGFDLVPEVQSLGHVQYITYAHPEIAEIDETLKDEVYHHSYCPSNEKSYEIIFDIIDEILEVSSPDRYVHIGHDEVYQMGLCEKCKDKNISDLLAYHITTLHDYIAKKGLKIMMWADMVHTREVAKESTRDAFFKIPKDILMLDFIWYFYLDGEIEDELLGHGFDVIVGNLYSSHFKNFNNRMKKEGMLGGQVSTWVAANENRYAFYGKFFDAMYLSQMLCNTDDYDERNRASYNKIICDCVQKAMREKVRAATDKFDTEKSVSIKPSKKQPPKDLAQLCDVVVLDEEEIAINDFAKRIVFEHATITAARRIPWKSGLFIGEYIINYEDGTSEKIDIEYGNNIMSYKSVYGMPMIESCYRHMGYEGTWNIDPVVLGKNVYAETISTFQLPFDNPHPDKKIKSICYKRDENEYLTVMLSSLKILN
ncbi:MAG: hypothetical protein E7410_01525 [Ruminococcaceae bacterium]|nr:hypothetical protein [Oscillospiraceae bacterium]